MKIACAQINSFLGDFQQASKQAISFIKKAESKADLLIFPEGGLMSYPPKDFLYRKDFFKIQQKQLEKIHKKTPRGLAVLMPAFIQKSDLLYNGTYLFIHGNTPRFFIKQFLPNENVFYETRYFTPGKAVKNFFIWKDKKIQVLICEDFWRVKNLQNPDIIISLNASPYRENKYNERLAKTNQLCKTYKASVVFLNRVGGQDDLIFDGRSFVTNKQGEKIWEGQAFAPDFKICNLNSKQKKLKQKPLSLEDEWQQALTLGIKDFVTQLGFSKAIIGLSGGLDSALTLYLTVKALGNKNVSAYFLPSSFTEPLSHKIASQVAKNLKVNLVEQDISKIHAHFLNFIFPKNKYKDLTSQNIQSRIRCLYLMAQANEHKSLLIGTGNKSELATGYSTLYGDLAGALFPIGDLWKTDVYQLARSINKKENIFPKKLMTRAPSAELSTGQKDEDDLLPYKELDSILEKLLNFTAPCNAKQKMVEKLLRNSEFKRKQSPPILKIKKISFGEGRRMPIANRFPF